jgi:hypothetical protein
MAGAGAERRVQKPPTSGRPAGRGTQQSAPAAALCRRLGGQPVAARQARAPASDREAVCFVSPEVTPDPRKPVARAGAKARRRQPKMLAKRLIIPSSTATTACSSSPSK